MIFGPRAAARWRAAAEPPSGPSSTTGTANAQSSRAADGSGDVRTVSAPNQLPGGQIVVDLEADADALYGLLLGSSFNGPPHGVVRISKAGGRAQTLLGSAD